MKNLSFQSISFKRYYAVSVLTALLLCAYPLFMGGKVLLSVWRLGYVPMEQYPKYVIPYTPIAVTVILSTALMPLLLKRRSKSFEVLSFIMPMGVFFALERLMETKILVKEYGFFPTESWQYSLCYVPPEMYSTRTWQAVDVLLGGYRPWFKIHFYLISIIITLGFTGVFYGFGKMIVTNNFRRGRALTLQCICVLAFTAMCIWACFTSFYREGELFVSPLSAALMCTFFALLGVTAGIFTASFLIGKSKAIVIGVPTAAAILTTITMYVGEMCLLNKELYRFGSGFFFDPLPKIVLAPIDIAVILISGIATALLCRMLNKTT